MGLLLDTNIISTHLKRPDMTFSKFVQHDGQLCTSQIVVAELYVWCWLSPNSIQRRQKVDAILTQAQPIAFDGECAWRFGELRERSRAAQSVPRTSRNHDARCGAPSSNANGRKTNLNFR